MVGVHRCSTGGRLSIPHFGPWRAFCYLQSRILGFMNVRIGDRDFCVDMRHISGTGVRLTSYEAPNSKAGSSTEDLKGCDPDFVGSA